MKQGSIWTIALGILVLGLSVLATTLVVNAGPTDQARQTVDIDLSEWAIGPKIITVTAGSPVRFNLKNTGRFPHNIEISGNNVDVMSATVPSNTTGTYEYTFQRGGAFAIWCSIGNGRHLTAGMWGTIHVLEAATGRLPQWTPPAPAPKPEAAPALAAGGRVVKVEMGDWFFEPKVYTVTAGTPIRFEMNNKGRLPHYIEVGGQGINVASGNVLSNTSGIYDYTFTKPGGYIVWCPIFNGAHLMRGMVATIVVTAPPGAPAQPAVTTSAQATPVRTTQLPRTGEADLPIGLITLSALGVAALVGGLVLTRRRIQ